MGNLIFSDDISPEKNNSGRKHSCPAEKNYESEVHWY